MPNKYINKKMNTTILILYKTFPQIKREQKLMAVFEETRSRPSHRPKLKLEFEEPPARSKEATNALAKLKYISGQGEQDFKN